MQILFNNKKINYTDTGRGEPLVLLHGFTETLKIWESFADHLSRQYRVICIDLPGHGGSECVDEVHNMDLMADVVKMVLDKISVDKSVIIGHSMGGYVALAFARKYGNMLKGMGLFHSSANADSEKAKEGRLRAAEVIRKDHHEFLMGFIPDLFAPENRKTFEKEIEALIKEAKNIPKEGIIAALLGMKDREDSNDVLSEAKYPVMFIAGHKDSRIPVKDVLTQTSLPDIAYSLLLKKSGHMGYIEEKQKTLYFLKAFIHACYETVSD